MCLRKISGFGELSPYAIFSFLSRCSGVAWVVMSLWFVPVDVWAEALSLADLIERLNHQNPRIEQRQQLQHAAAASVAQTLSLSNPQIGFIQNPIPSSPLRMGASQGFSYTLTQAFSFPGKKQLAAEMAQGQVDVLGTQTELLKGQLLAQLKISFWQLLALQRQVNSTEESLRRLDQIKQSAKIQYANNAAAYVDYLNAQVAEGSLQNDLFQLKLQMSTLASAVGQMVGLGPQYPLTVKGDFTTIEQDALSLEDYERAAMQFHPALKGAAFQVHMAEQDIAYAQKAYFPDFQVVATKMSDHPPWGLGGNRYGLELDLILPSWGFEKERAGLDRTRANLAASLANDQVTRQQVLLGVVSAYNTLKQTREQVHFIRTHQWGIAQTTWHLALQNYATHNGKGYAEVLLAHNNLRSVELALLQSELVVAQAWGNLELAVGIGLDAL